MKRILMSIAVVALSITATQAQVNKTVKEESTVKRVITKEGSDVKIKEIKDTDTESGAVIVKDNNETNQEFSETTKKDSDKKIMVDETNVDLQNEAMIAEKKLQQQEQLEASKKQQAELAAKKKMEYEAKQAQMQKELAERRAQLESRPKGMSKLKKD
ncbi:hypothetical protein [Aequorivita sp. CIP111184]|uniref:hypothetical protein n=1 Tax=Aequorivita sp. CIP111184 TaxID=2211356 RepID=UPI000DBC1800|nr:hypothetical protein [Aequorivita sp. CIP111184]SRX55993.1 hypothetical protein AEQU1_03019 [Aequorivita sp. CIP111184]